MKQLLQKPLAFVLILTFVIAWVFSGYPQIRLEYGDVSMSFPPSVEFAHAVAFSRTYITYLVSASTLTTYTYTNVDISAGGAADAARRVVVGITGDTSDASANSAISSVTIGGVSATNINGGNLPGSDALARIQLWEAVVPTGTTATIVVTYGETQKQSNVFVWVIQGAGGAASDSDFATGTGASISLSTVTVPTGGSGIWVWANGAQATAAGIKKLMSQVLVIS